MCICVCECAYVYRCMYTCGTRDGLFTLRVSSNWVECGVDYLQQELVRLSRLDFSHKDQLDLRFMILCIACLLSVFLYRYVVPFPDKLSYARITIIIKIIIRRWSLYARGRRWMDDCERGRHSHFFCGPNPPPGEFYHFRPRILELFLALCLMILKIKFASINWVDF